MRAATASAKTAARASPNPSYGLVRVLGIARYAPTAQAPTVTQHNGQLQCKAAVDGQYLAGDVIVGFEQEAHRACHIGGLTETRNDSVGEVAIVLAAGNARLGHTRLIHPRADYVHANVGGSPSFLGEDSSRMHQRGFGRGIRG